MKRVLLLENLVKTGWKVDQCHFSCIANMVELLFMFSLELCLMLLVMTVFLGKVQRSQFAVVLNCFWITDACKNLVKALGSVSKVLMYEQTQ